MTDPLKNGAMTIQRAAVLDGLRSLYLAQCKFSPLLKEDSYACGCRDGFETALEAVALLVGVEQEFRQEVKRLDIPSKL